jgi:hypothetical protein
MIDERDELIERAARALSALPPTKAGAVARVLMAVRANQARPLPFWKRAARRFEETSVSGKAMTLLMAASLVIGFFARPVVSDTFVGIFPEAAAGPSGTALQTVANLPAESRPVPVALAVELANAKTVSVVGDFNGWDPSVTPMQRVGKDGPWSATVLAKPGRHTYAFMVDGATLVADPRAPRARSNDFDGDASVMMVRTP